MHTTDNFNKFKSQIKLHLKINIKTHFDED